MDRNAPADTALILVRVVHSDGYAIYAPAHEEDIFRSETVRKTCTRNPLSFRS